MTHRSTRNKLRFQVVRVQGCIDRIQEHWALLDELAGGKSEYVNDMLPLLVASIEEYREACKSFRSGL